MVQSTEDRTGRDAQVRRKPMPICLSWSRHVRGWLRFPQLYEVQRPKGRADLALIAETFRPYLEAREWRTIQNPTP